MMFEEESIMAEIQNVLGRMEIYEKKSTTMGLSTSEEKLFADLAVRYVKLRLYLFDNIFNKYVLNDILYGEAEAIAKELYDSLGWNLEMVINKDEISSIYNRYGKIQNKKWILSRVKKLHKVLRKNLMSIYIELDDKEIWECISVVISDGESKSPKILLSHLDYKFESIYMIIDKEED